MTEQAPPMRRMFDAPLDAIRTASNRETLPPAGPPTRPAKVRGAPPFRENDSFESFDLSRNPKMRAAFVQCERVAQGLDWCALLAGFTGNGKTHLAIAAGNVFDGGVTFWKVSDLLQDLRDSQFTERRSYAEVIDSLRTDVTPAQSAEGRVVRPEVHFRRLLILDDLGTENQTDWAHEQLYRILDARYDRRLPTILTTNQKQERIDGRLRSRFAEGLVVCEGADMRRVKR